MHALAFVLLLATADDVAPKIDAIFADYAKPDTPGCAVAVSKKGEIVFERAYGMANLEYDIPLKPDLIFEAGSVTKQFTAAAVMLLEQDGKLSLDDKVVKYIPELDASAKDITIRQMLTHTSGLRDWGSIVNLAGWRRGSRLFTMPHVLDVISKQRELNFPPGTQWSYSNSGYNLAAILVERVSGKSFPEFTRERLFAPNNMTHSSWRDEYRRVVKGRATAYNPTRAGYMMSMDIENIYGNCCLLTTVGDLLRWKTLPNQEAVATLADGRKTQYGLGLFSSPDGTEIYHGGATAGWRASLSHNVPEDVAVAVLCNRGDANAGGLGNRVEALFVPQTPQPQPVPLPADAATHEGLYRDMKTNAIVRVMIKDDRLRIGLSPNQSGPITPIEGSRYRLGQTGEVRFADDRLTLITNTKPDAVYTRVQPAKPVLADYVGTYASDEVGTTFTIAIDGDHLVVKQPPSGQFTMEPTYKDGFVVEGDLVHFTRSSKGRVDGFDVKSDFSPGSGSARVERVHFVRR
jgi:CubicO group peptidase (beta-lactamase class C family)